MLEKQRHRLILDLLLENRYLTLRDLTRRLDASEATLRRDLAKLERVGALKRLRGGAELPDAPGLAAAVPSVRGSTLLVGLERHGEEKRRLARAAAARCVDGECIIVNGGSTTFMMAEFLVGRDLVVITNSFALAGKLIASTRCRVIVPGGEIHRTQSLILSNFDHDALSRYHATRMFTSAAAVNQFGIMEQDPLVARAGELMLRQAAEVIVLADRTKLGAHADYVVAPLDRIDWLITGAAPDAVLSAALDEAAAGVIQVSAPVGAAPGNEYA